MAMNSTDLRFTFVMNLRVNITTSGKFMIGPQRWPTSDNAAYNKPENTIAFSRESTSTPD